MHCVSLLVIHRCMGLKNKSHQKAQACTLKLVHSLPFGKMTFAGRLISWEALGVALGSSLTSQATMDEQGHPSEVTTTFLREWMRSESTHISTESPRDCLPPFLIDRRP